MSLKEKAKKIIESRLNPDIETLLGIRVKLKSRINIFYGLIKLVNVGEKGYYIF